MKREVTLIYTAVNAEAARVTALDDLTERWGKQCGAVIRLWENPGSSSSRSWIL